MSPDNKSEEPEDLSKPALGSDGTEQTHTGKRLSEERDRSIGGSPQVRSPPDSDNEEEEEEELMQRDDDINERSISRSHNESPIAAEEHNSQ